jgi:uncharacterized protein YggE
MKALKIFGAIFLLAAVLSLYVVAGQDANAEPKHTIAVSATSTIYAEPDLAIITFSVVNEAQTASKAMNENVKRMNAIISHLKQLGVDDKDLKTTNFNISLRYEQDNATRKRVLVGYQMYQSLLVKIRNFQKLADVIQGALDFGANQVSNLVFMIENSEDIQKQARLQAIEKAKIKAQELADKLGIQLGKVVGFNENSSAIKSFNARASMDVAGASPQIEAGENEIAVTITIIYEIK